MTSQPTPRESAVDVVRRFGGIARWRDITRYSTGNSVRCAVRAGELCLIGRGLYALPEPAPTAVAAACARGVLSHQSAAAHWLLEGFGPTTLVHVTVPRHGRSRSVPGVLVHYADLQPKEEHAGFTTPLRTVLDCASILPFAEALAVADSALRRDLVSAEELMIGAQGRLGHGRAARLAVAAAADPRAANPLESTLRATLIQARIAGFTPQLPVHAGARTRYLDLGHARAKIALEADSFAFHGTRQALVRDCSRYNELVRHGWLVLRFTWEDVITDPRGVVEVVSDTCRLRR